MSKPLMPAKKDTKMTAAHEMLIRNVATGSCKEVIKGDTSELMFAFAWRLTKQGFDYWDAIYEGVIPLSDEDREYIQSLIDEATDHG